MRDIDGDADMDVGAEGIPEGRCGELAVELCESAVCTGCMACLNVCPYAAIEMKEDEWGETHPVIDAELCRRCNLCVETCPVLSPVEMHEVMQCLAGWIDDPAERAGSSSGGIAYALAKSAVSTGGVAIGAAFARDLHLVHTSAGDPQALESIRGSKYVQSDVGLSYRLAKEHLEAGDSVVFTGTPCQIAGLQKFLGRAYSRLVTVDIVCHGVPPLRYLKEHIAAVVPSSQTVADVSFRDQLGFRLRLSNGFRSLYSSARDQDLYFYAFIRGVTYRESCYTCQFAQRDRCSDLTLGDYWGLDRESLSTRYDGRVSLILVNTDRGGEALDALGSSVHLEDRPIMEGVAGNPQLNRPTRRHPARDEFRRAYPKEGFARSLRRAGVSREVRMVTLKSRPPYVWLRSLKHRVASMINPEQRGGSSR